MNTLEQLSLEAFQLALSRLEEPLPAALAQQVQTCSEDWAAHIGELRTLTDQFEPLKAHYQAARLELQSQSADRKQFLENGFQLHDGNNSPIDQSSTITVELQQNLNEAQGVQLQGVEITSAGRVITGYQGSAKALATEVSFDYMGTPSHGSRPYESGIEPVAVSPVSTPLAQSRILKALERSRLTAQELICTLNQPPQQTQEILQTLWQKGYIEELSASLPHILFPGLRSPQYRNHFPDMDTILTLTSRGYFSLYPFMTRNKRMVSA
jgi:hypothetical protein